MDDILKLAYKALENWRSEVTVDQFIEDNKRLNSNKNINSPTVHEFLNYHYFSDISVEEQNTIDNNWAFSLDYIPRFKDEYNFEKVFNFLIASSNIQKRVDANISSDITSIVVYLKNREVHLDKPTKILALEDPKGIDVLFNQSQYTPIQTSRRSIENEVTHVSKMFDFAIC